MKVLTNNSIMLAPMEGITKPYFRKIIQDLYPDSFDAYYSDFLRIPSSGKYKFKHIMHHFVGPENFNAKTLHKSAFQVLFSAKSKIKTFLETFKLTNINWLDLNLGCPSKKVTGHGGGSSLLGNLNQLEKLIAVFRTHHTGKLSAKIRLGVDNTEHFPDILKLLTDQGVDLITIHARTMKQLYKGKANWKFFETAKAVTNIPIAANGDIWTGSDIKFIFEDLGIDHIMLGRSALKTPWLAELYKENQTNIEKIEQDKEYFLQLRVEKILKYFNRVKKVLQNYGKTDSEILKKLKELSRYPFDDFDQSQKLKSKLLRSNDLNSFDQSLSKL